MQQQLRGAITGWMRTASRRDGAPRPARELFSTLR